VTLDRLPGAGADSLHDLGAAIDRQCALPRPPGRWAEWCADADGRNADLRRWLDARFVAVELVDGKRPEGLVTGYYEPVIRGSRQRQSLKQVPILARPQDLLTIELAAIEPRLQGLRLRGRLDGQRVVPYYTRESMASRPAGDAEILGWADDPVDLFFVEIQGSGRVALRDGSELRIGYADQNGHPYRAIGRTLIDRGALQAADVTAPAIKAWLRANGSAAPAVMNSNPSQVFFRVLPGEVAANAGPPGSLGVPLTPLRSVAVDRREIALGTMLYVSTLDPVDGRAIERFVVAQDTGGAIAGTKRLDLFWGLGSDAELAAGLMKAPARIWKLVPVDEAATGLYRVGLSEVLSVASPPPAVAAAGPPVDQPGPPVLFSRSACSSCWIDIAPGTRLPLAKKIVGVPVTLSLRPSSLSLSIAVAHEPSLSGTLPEIINSFQAVAGSFAHSAWRDFVSESGARIGKAKV
jgi:membrane-bound lytic murein transglycosylase A